MPAVLEAVNQPAAKPLDARLARAAGRIRMTDLLVGVLSLMVITLTYAAAMILIDRSAELPGWLRQMGFVAWLGSMAYVGYRLIVRPLTAVLNPLFVAKQVESAIPDAHNVVVNYVDLKERDLPASVRTAVEKQASSEVTDADIVKAGESRTLVGLGIAAAGLAVLLAVFFLAFSPAQFFSLVKRAFQPFANQSIVSKTRITIVHPADPNPTITAGTPVLLHVSLDGRLPAPDTDERTRLILRHNPDDPIGETVPFEPGATNREFVLKVPEYLVQNGFWYRIAAGDGETDEYRVTVRPRILLTNVRVKYDYPKYLRMPSETVDRPQIEAYRGTIVTVTATANRPVTGGRLMIDQQDVAIRGQAVEDGKVSLTFTVAESGTYRIFLTTADNETSIDPPVYPIKVITDNPPTVRIEKPEAEEIELPLNGLLAIDAIADDDLGLAQLTTKVKLGGEGGKVLVDRPYRLGLKRDADGSYPRRVEIKESVKLAELAGLKEGDVLEYWIEATDNRELSESEKGQVGVSAVKKVKLTAIPKEPEKQQEQKRQGEQRQNQQQQHDQNQKQKMDGEKRPPPPGQKEKQENPEQNPDQKGQPSEDPMKGSGEANPMNPKPQEGGEKGSPMNPMEGGGEKGTPMNPKPMEGGEKGSPMNPMGGEKPNPMNSKPQEGGGEKGSPMTTKPQEGGGEKGSPTNSNDTNQSIDPAQKQKLEEQANKVNKELGTKGGQPQSGGQQGGEMSQEQKQQLQEAAKDLNSSDPAKRAAAEKTIDNAIGKENREAAQKEAEQLKKDLQSNDPKTREAAKQKVEKMAEQMKPQGGGQEGGQKGGEMTPEQKEKFQQAAKDMASNDPAKKAAGEKAMDEMVGKENRQAMQQQAEQMKKDLQSDDPKTREAAKQKLEQMAEQMKKPNAGQEAGAKGGEMTPEQKEKFQQAARDMASSDPAKKAAGEKAMDDMIGKQNREAAQKQADQIKKDLQSDDPKTREAAKQKLEQMANDIKKQQGGPGMSEQEKKDLAKAGEGMKSGNPMDKGSAEQKVDDALGQKERDAATAKAEQAKQDLKTGSDAQKADAAKQLETMAQGNGERPSKPGMSEQEKKDLAKAAQDLGSDDPEKRAAAEKAIDEKIGSDARKQAQKDADQLKKDLQSDDAKTREAAQQKLQQMANEMKKQGAGQPSADPAGQKASNEKPTGGKPPSPEEMKQMRDAARGLASDNPEEKAAAQKTLDEKIGEENRRKAEQMASDLKSNDPATRRAAEQKLKEMAQQANAGKPDRSGERQPSPEEIRKEQEKLANAARDLSSKDDAARQKAEKELDEKIGEKNRKDVQQAMKDLQSGDPQKQQEGQKKLDELMKQAEANAGKMNKDWRPGGGGGITGEKGGPALEDNPLNRLKTAELQLKTFKDNRTNKELLNKLQMNEQEYAEFVAGYEKLVEAERKRIAVMGKSDPGREAPKTINANRGGEKLGQRGEGTGPTGATAGNAPPGYSDATRKFAEEAAKKGQSPK